MTRLSPEDTLDIATLVSTGMKYREIAEELHWPTSTVASVAHRIGAKHPGVLPIRKAGRDREFSRDEARALLASGLSYTEVGRRLSVTPQAIYMALKRC